MNVEVEQNVARPPLEIGTYGTVTRTEISPDKWRARTRYRDHDGVTRLVERYGATGAAAERALKAALRDRARPTDADEITRDTTIRELGAAWIASLPHTGKVSPQTVEKYTRTINKHIVPALGGVRVGEISVGKLERFLNAVEGDGTARWCRVCLTGMFSMAARHDAIGQNPVRETSTRDRPATEIRALTLEEVALLRKNIAAWAGSNTMGPPRGDDLAELVDVLLGTGLRIGEALALRWPDVDLDSEIPTITVAATIAQVGGKYFLQETAKTKAGHRAVVLPRFVVDALRRQRERELPAEDGLVFPSARGGVRSPNNVRRQLRQARGDDLGWVTPHAMRRTAATFIDRAAGVDAAAAQLGHSGTRVTTAHYVQKAALAPDLRDALEAMLDV